MLWIANVIRARVRVSDEISQGKHQVLRKLCCVNFNAPKTGEKKLRAREREKWRRRCMKRKLSTCFSALPRIGEPTCYKQPRPLFLEAKQSEISEQDDHSRSMNKTCTKLMYLVDEQTYHNYIKQAAATGSREERPVMEQNLPNRLENTEQNQETKMLLTLLNSIKRLISSQSSSDSSGPVMPLRECLASDVVESVKPVFVPSCKKVDKKKRKREGKHKRNAKRRTVRIIWEPL